MSNFLKKLAQRQPISNQDWLEYLEEAHRKNPGLTMHGFSNFFTEKSRTSYQVLAQSMEGIEKKGEPRRILDLGCGNGYFFSSCRDFFSERDQWIGLDISREELELAQSDPSLSKAHFIRGKAWEIPLEKESVDFIFSHLSLMLMVPLEAVIEEIFRILIPGGKLAFVIPRPYSLKSVYGGLQHVLNSFLSQTLPALNQIPPFPSQFKTPEGIRSLFQEKFFFRGPTQVLDFSLRIPTAPGPMWDFFSKMYFIELFTEKQKQALSGQMEEALRQQGAGESILFFEYPLRRVILYSR